MPVALHGNLRDFGIGEVFQLIGQQQKTGILEVVADDQRIRVTFEGGVVVWGEQAGPYPEAGVGEKLVRTGLLSPERLVELEQAIHAGAEGLLAQLQERGEVSVAEIEDTLDLVTRDTIFTLLRWTRGSFHFTAQPVFHTRDPDRLLPADQILMDGLRMVDEWRTLHEGAREENTVFARKGRVEAWREAHPSLSPERVALAERVFLLVDGRLPVSRVIDLARISRFEGATLLSQLARAGVIAPLAPEAAARKPGRRVGAGLGAAGAGVAALALAALPFVLLLALVGMLAGRGPLPAPPGDPAARLEQRAADAMELRRLRNAIEAFRFARGRWPEDVEEAARFAGAPLAAAADREYYFARRGDSFVLLPPSE
jgi:hypothetical protein